MRSLRLPAIAASLALVGACVDQGPGPQPKKVDPGYVPRHLLAKAPPLTEALDVELGGKVVYLGYTTSAQTLVPGQPFRITHYWKVVEPPGPRWRVFSRMRGAPNTADFMSLPETEMQRGHGPATWRAGEIIEDEQEIYLRPDWKSREATLLVGLIEVGAHGILDRMQATGPRVRDRAVLVRTFPVDVDRAPPPPGTVHVPYALGEITIDGTATEPGWANAARSGDFVTAEGSPEPAGKATARLAWDDANLYVHVSVVDPDIFSEYKNQDDPLWKQDAVELFIDADGNRRGYVELQVNPNNATFDSWFPQGRAAKGDEAWDAGMVSAVKVRGTPDVAGDADQGWDVEIAIPWAAVKGRDDKMNVRLPPQVGDRWRINVVRVDRRSGAANPAASSWNRITYADWHGLDRMLTVVFADQKGGVAPGTAPRPVEPPPADQPSADESSSAEAPPAGAPSGAESAERAGGEEGSAAAVAPSERAPTRSVPTPDLTKRAQPAVGPRPMRIERSELRAPEASGAAAPAR